MYPSKFAVTFVTFVTFWLLKLSFRTCFSIPLPRGDALNLRKRIGKNNNVNGMWYIGNSLLSTWRKRICKKGCALQTLRTLQQKMSPHYARITKQQPIETSTMEKYHFSCSSSRTVRTLRSSNNCILSHHCAISLAYIIINSILIIINAFIRVAVRQFSP